MGDVGTGGYARVDGGRVECGGPGERAAGLYGEVRVENGVKA